MPPNSVRGSGRARASTSRSPGAVDRSGGDAVPLVLARHRAGAGVREAPRNAMLTQNWFSDTRSRSLGREAPACSARRVAGHGSRQRRGSDASGQRPTQQCSSADNDRRRHPGGESGALADGRAGRADPAAGLLPDRTDGELQPGAHPRAPTAREGRGCVRDVPGHQRRQPVHEGRRVPAGHRDRTVIRFSTVAGERGSPDTWRDPRGFAVKFYTSEGNLDIVGNNVPIFFIRDPIKFQNFIRSQKRLAANNLRDADMQWDFWTLSPESAHMLSLAHGRPGHTQVVASHERVLVAHLHVGECGERAVLGQVPLQDRTRASSSSPRPTPTASPARTPTTTSGICTTRIERGDHPSWTLKMQIMPFEDAKTYRFNPFDLTKVWPHGDYPLIDVGKMTLNRNVTDYHTEIEQAAFQPNNTVPGTGLSPDKMLLARGFSYADAHRARLGVNYQQIPVNRPKSPVRGYSKDGAMRIDNVTDPVYYPNSVDGAPAADTVDLRRARGLGGRWRDGAGRLHAPRRGRRLRPGQHDDQQGARRRPREPAGGQRRRARRGLQPGGHPPARVRVLAQHRQVDR